jgi:hypothetical protein
MRAWKRNLNINPFFLPVPILGAAKPVKIGNATLRAAGVTSYVMQNPNPVWVWYRGWNGSGEAIPEVYGKGHLIAPGGEHLRASQTPDWIVAVPWERAGWPLLASDGKPLYAEDELSLVYTLGSGGL